MDGPRIRLETASAASLVARLVVPGARYGPDDRFVNATAGSLVDFSVARGSALRHVGTYEVDDVRACCARPDGFTPGGRPAYKLGRSACRRLAEWTLDPGAAALETLTALLIGDDDTCARAALVLRRLGFETQVTHDAVRGLAQASSLPPSLVVVDADGLTRLSAPQLLARLRASSRARATPVIVVAADPAAHRALPADAVLRSPVGQSEVAEAITELFELV
ncbi:MAG TPA: hypothetical protein VLN26_01195 [Gaiellaceae bacterium]|nr:hypothetical protein [Gaiellaceae bacterium]